MGRILYEESPALCYDDVQIVPAVFTTIKHRNECDPFLKTDVPGFNSKKTLPIFASPMTTVVDVETSKIYEENNIIPVIPRCVSYEKRYEILNEGKWVAFSLSEFDSLVKAKDLKDNYHILIDVANGHMLTMINYCNTAKKVNKNIKLMAGNVANPHTIKEYMIAGIDYVRCSVGTGSGCITSSNTGIHYPIASLISDTYNYRETIWNQKRQYSSDIREQMVKTKIIADGGIRNYDDVCKALVLGADYVMIGGLFASCIESPGELYEKGITRGIQSDYYNKLSDEIVKQLKESGEFILDDIFPYRISLKGNKIYKKFYGMASAQGQIDINGEKKKTSEGCEKYILVNKSLYKWSKNMTDYLKSTMSYTDCRTLKYFSNVDLIRVSDATKKSINQ